MVDYVRDPTPHDNFGKGSATVGGLCKLCDLSHLWVSFLSFFLLSSARALRSHLLTDRHNLRAKMCVSGKDVPFGDSTMSDYIYGVWPHKCSRTSSKIAIYRSPKKIFVSNFTDRFSTGGTIEKVQNYIKWNCEGADLLLKFWDPLHISGMVEVRNFKFDKKCKIRSKEVGRGHVTYFWNFGTPYGWSKKLQIWHAYRSQEALTNQMQN